MPIKPIQQRSLSGQSNDANHRLYDALENAESKRQELVDSLATRLADLGDPELLTKDVLLASKRIIKDRKNTTTIDQTVAILDDYDPITAIFGGDSYGFLALAEGDFSGSMSDPKMLNGSSSLDK